MILLNNRRYLVLTTCVLMMSTTVTASETNDIFIVPQIIGSIQFDERDILTNDETVPPITSHTDTARGNLDFTDGIFTYEAGEEFWSAQLDHFSYTTATSSGQVFLVADELGASRLTTQLDLVIESSPTRVVLREGILGPSTLPRSDWTVVINTVQRPYVKFFGEDIQETRGTMPGGSGGGKGGGGLDIEGLQLEDSETVTLVRYSVGEEPTQKAHAELMLKNDGGQYVLSAAVYQTDGSPMLTREVVLEEGEGMRNVAARWWPASHETARDGGVALEIDRRLVAIETGIDNPAVDLSSPESFEVTFGPVDTDANISGDFYLAHPNFVHLNQDRPTLNPAFADHFESGQVLAWSQTGGNSGHMAVTAEAALHGIRGLEIEPLGPSYLVDTSPRDTFSYRARFSFDPGALNLADGQELTLLSVADIAGGGPAPFSIHLRRDNSLWTLCAEAETGSQTVPLCAVIDENRIQRIEVHWRSARTAQASGGLRLWLDAPPLGDRVEVGSLDLDNFGQTVGTIHFGIVALTLGATGKIYLDDFESWQ